MKKIKNRQGETLVETLVAILIIALVFSFTMTSAVVASRINEKIRNIDISCNMSQEDANQGVVASSYDGMADIPVTQYTDNDYHFYEAE